MRVPCTLILLAACTSDLPPAGQVLLYLDADAPGLFDRVMVEIYPPGESAPCAECSRELAVDAAKMRARAFSFGVVMRPRVVGYRVRVRLFRSAFRPARPESTVEIVGYLPAVAEDGIVEMTAVLRAEDTGKPKGTLDAPVLFDRGAPGPVTPWPDAAKVPCPGSAPEGASCVEGGAFFMGDPRVPSGLAGRRERLVVLSPFYLDRREVTVADFRSSGLARKDSQGRLVDPQDGRNDPFDRCDYSDAPGTQEMLPLNCVSFELARAYCQKKGGALPTEAQLEMVASARGTRLWPWGDDDARCEDAVAARGARCGPDAGLDPTFPEPAGRGELDRAGDILDLGANLSEQALDVFQWDDEPCWTPVLVRDPVCTTQGRSGDARSAKGGHYDSDPIEFAQIRGQNFGSRPELGFRCAYPAR